MFSPPSLQVLPYRSKVVTGNVVINGSNVVTSIVTHTLVADGDFLVSGTVEVTAWTSGSLSTQLSFTSVANVAQSYLTLTGLIQGATSTTIGAQGLFCISPLVIRARAGTTITLSTNATANLTYRASGTIIQLQ